MNSDDCLPINFLLLDKYESIFENELAPKFLYCFSLLKNRPSSIADILTAAQRLNISLVNKNEINHVRFKINNWNNFASRYYEQNNSNMCECDMESGSFHRVCKMSKKKYLGFGRGYVYWINVKNWEIFDISTPYIPLSKEDKKTLKRKYTPLLIHKECSYNPIKLFRSIGTSTTLDSIG
jgi:hypothetical protein